MLSKPEPPPLPDPTHIDDLTPDVLNKIRAVTNMHRMPGAPKVKDIYQSGDKLTVLCRIDIHNIDTDTPDDLNGGHEVTLAELETQARRPGWCLLRVIGEMIRKAFVILYEHELDERLRIGAHRVRDPHPTRVWEADPEAMDQIGK